MCVFVTSLLAGFIFFSKAPYVVMDLSVFPLDFSGNVCVVHPTFFTHNVLPADLDSWDEFFAAHRNLCADVIDELVCRLNAGVTLRPVVIGYGYDGNLRVYNGQHRVLAYLITGLPVRYKLGFDKTDGAGVYVEANFDIAVPYHLVDKFKRLNISAFSKLVDFDDLDDFEEGVYDTIRSFPVSDGWAESVSFSVDRSNVFNNVSSTHFSVVLTFDDVLVEQVEHVFLSRLSGFDLMNFTMFNVDPDQ